MTAFGLVFSNIHDKCIPELTRRRTMASVPFGCRYRLIDFTLSNLVFLTTVWAFSIGSVFKAIVSGCLVVLSALCCVYSYKQSKKQPRGAKLRLEPIYISFLIAMVLLVLEIVGGIRTAVDAAGLGASVGDAFIYGVMFFQYLVGGIYYTIKLIKEA